MSSMDTGVFWWFGSPGNVVKARRYTYFSQKVLTDRSVLIKRLAGDATVVESA